MKKRIANEPQNQIQFDAYYSQGGVVLGPHTSHIWRHDPRHLAFLLSRYKFCAKMLKEHKTLLEVGCGDSFGTAIVLQVVDRIHAVDIEPLVIKDNQQRVEYGERCSYEILDITTSSTKEQFEGGFSLDVIEHIPRELEEQFLLNITKSLQANATFILSTPNVTSREYASPQSAEGHINLKSADELGQLLSRHFHNHFIFSMNDEVVHTGYSSMAHYLFGMGVGVRR